uniref:hypothetical protein n=1 Tax=Amycolatopsis sp. CA-096443 TaxID=3239919 RepID=UPI003F498798
MDIIDYSDELVLARHPEHGLLIAGYVVPQVADFLCTKGFQRGDDKVLLLPATMPEDDARALLERAARVLARTGHNMTFLGDQEAAEWAAAVSEIPVAAAVAAEQESDPG